MHPLGGRGALSANAETEEVTIELPKSLVAKISSRVPSSGFKSVSEYVSFVLDQALVKFEEKSSITSEDQKKIEQRLRDLGYL